MKKSLTSLLFKLGGKQTKSNWAQNLAIIGISGIAMTLLIGFFANSNALETRLNTLISETNYASMYVTTDATKKGGYDYDLIDEAIGDKKAQIESRFYFFCNLNTKSSLGAIYHEMPTISKPYRILEKDESESRDNFFVVDQLITSDDTTLSKSEEIKLGTEIETSIDISSYKIPEEYISFLDSYVKEGKQNPLKNPQIPLKFKVTSVMQHPENAAKASLMPPVFLLSSTLFRDTLRTYLEDSLTDNGIKILWMFGFKGVLNWGDGNPHGDTTLFPMHNQYLVKLHDVPFDQAKSNITKAFKQKSTDNLLSIQSGTQTQAISNISDDVSQAKSLTWVFPIVFFAVALLVIVASTRQLILRERMVIGTFKAVGLNKKEIYTHFVGETALVVAVGCIIGLIIGPLLLPSLLSAKYDLLYVLPARVYSFPVLPIIGAVAVILGATILIAFSVVRKEVKLKPVESMRPADNKVRGFAVKKENRKLLNLSLAMTGRNLIQDPVKSLMVIIGVLGCTMLLCSGFGIEDTLNHSINTDPFLNSGADISIFFTGDQSKERIASDFSIKDEAGNELIYGYQNYYRVNMELTNNEYTYSTYLNAIDEYTLVKGDKIKSHFNYEIPLGKAVLSEKVAERLHASIGSQISYVLGGEKETVEVAKIFPAFYDNGIFINMEEQLMKKNYQKYSAVWLDVIDQKQVDYVASKTREISYVGVSDTASAWKAKVSQTISSIWVLTNAIKVFAILLAIVVIYNLGLLNFRERIREIATLKVMGVYIQEIAISLLIEVLSLVMIGVAGGLALGYPFMSLLLYVNQVEKVDFINHMNLSTYFISFVLTFVVALVVNLILMSRIRKIKSVEALKSVE